MDKTTETLFWARICGVGTIIGIGFTAIYGYPVWREALERRKHHERSGKVASMPKPFLIPVATASIILLVATVVLFDMWLYFSIYQTHPRYFWLTFAVVLAILAAVWWLTANAVVTKQTLAKRETDWELHASLLVKQGDENLRLANEEHQKEIDNLKAGESQQHPSKLVIHCATYAPVKPGGKSCDVTEFMQQIIRGDSLVLQIENHNFDARGWGGRNFVPEDPLPFTSSKFLRVKYSYNGSPPVTIERPEHSRLTLPLDSICERVVGSLDIGDSDPLIYAEFSDDRGVTVGTNNEGYITLINRGGSDALNVCITPLELAGHIVKFPQSAYVISPQKSKHRY